MEKQLDSQSNYERNVNKFFDEPRKNKTLADTYMNLQNKVKVEEQPKVEINPNSSIYKRDAAKFYGQDRYSET